MAAQILVARTREESRDVHPAAACALGAAAVIGVLPAMTVLLAASLFLAAVFGPFGTGVAGIDHGSPGWRQQVEPDSLIVGEEPPRTWLWPVVGRMTTHYGGCTAAMCPHWGIDIAAQLGTPVRAAADGVITTIGWDPDGYGHFIVLDHGSGWQTLYAHLQPGTLSGYGMTIRMAVHRGDAIGGLGSSGASTGPHLHFEVRQNGAHVDPTRILGA
ncbi:MAG: M23 family metallopeptidase [Chloroflexi bacterium]|nr:M23 family metallopeptidase [Chloroflexota bacterium]MCY3913933.1 M23 family metallopeptidase [Chloroflexota bacterium]